MSVSDTRLGHITHRFAELEARLGSGTLEGADFIAASRDYAELEPVARIAQEIAAMREEITSLAALDDPDMRELAEEELARINAALPEAEHRLAIAMLPRDSADSRPAMLEIRAGTGGDEAALFAADLFRMYEKYAVEQGWRVEVVSVNANDIGGYKEVVANVAGNGVFAKLKFESGVHRVQRVPVTESGGRIHTSAATVAVLPEPDEVDVRIEDKDLKIDVYRASGAGGQHVNTTDSAVRITHLPTGTVVTCQDGRSQHKNKDKAMQVLRARLFEAQRDAAQGEEAEARKAMVGSGDRSERIRTYNFPQGRVTDHRINLTLHRLPEVLEGVGLGELVDALIAEDQAKRLASMDG
ncbi:MAG: peptide chain release factor 1 [Novosphingobium sp. 32-60-15]|uniref:peptide chain release factor 1 n=1 Tax=unclassified Novosphingobium TaxID=2644732 RepID=UPI000BC7EED3|nr:MULTISPECIES: peptide chain release factor 1 [unclassified Novosphingobium]OYX62390.1 MAG: peptide chain release factor 1 [Novosphingobium sp. 32-60-15]